ncbi:MAG: hypothetical protein Kow009_10930 [Spirochaetales bacterium]
MRKSTESDEGKWARVKGRPGRKRRAARDTIEKARAVGLVVALGWILVGMQGLGLPGVSFSMLDPFDSGTRRQAQSLLSSLSVEEKCAAVLLVAYGSSSQSKVEVASRYQKIPVGGYLFFAYHIPKTVEALIDLTDGIQASVAEGRSRGTVPFLAIDHEGGTVMRLRGLVTGLPDARELGMSKAPAEKIQRLFRIVSRELFLLGFSMNLAPVVEPLSPENRFFLERRTYSSDPARTAQLGEWYLKEMREAGIVGVAKHFPGSGDGDPHERLPESSAKPSESTDPYTLPFRVLKQKGVLDAVMVSHVRLPHEGVEEPASLSSRVLQGILRSQWGFDGLVMTDDILMRGLTQAADPAEGVIQALLAGVDMVMYLGGDDEKIHRALVEAAEEGRVPIQRLDEAVQRILTLKIRYGMVNPDRQNPPPRTVQKVERLAELHSLKRKGDALVQEILQGGELQQGKQQEIDRQ